LHEKAPYSIDHRIVWPGGEIRHVHEEAEVSYSNNGKPAHMTGTVIDITRHKQAEERLNQYQSQLRELLSALSVAEEQERRRIAADLHDRTIQNLGLCRFKLGALRGPQASPELSSAFDELDKIIEQTIQETRTLVFELSPAVLYELGFTSAVEWLAEQIQKLHGIVCEVYDDHQPKPLDDSVSVILFQVMRELFMNIVKHARAKRAWITIRKDNDHIRIQVKDDGVGFDASNIGYPLSEKGGYGLFSIRERLKLLGERLEIVSAGGQGTTVTLSAPLDMAGEGVE